MAPRDVNSPEADDLWSCAVHEACLAPCPAREDAEECTGDDAARGAVWCQLSSVPGKLRELLTDALRDAAKESCAQLLEGNDVQEEERSVLAARQLTQWRPQLCTHSTALSRAAILRYVMARKTVGTATAVIHTTLTSRRSARQSSTQPHERSLHPIAPRRCMTASSGRALYDGAGENIDGGGGALPERDLGRLLRSVEGRVKERRRWREGDAAEGPSEGPVSM